MINRELYMSRIRPFIGKELIKALTGIRRSGKSVMLDLIKRELDASGVNENQFISINFENMSNAHLCFAEALHEEITRRVKGIDGKAFLFFDEIQEVTGWEKCINSFRVEFDCDIYHRIKCQAAFGRAGHLPCGKVCRVCDLSLFLW